MLVYELPKIKSIDVFLDVLRKINKGSSEVTESFLELFRQTEGAELRVRLDSPISKDRIFVLLESEERYRELAYYFHDDCLEPIIKLLENEKFSDVKVKDEKDYIELRASGERVDLEVYQDIFENPNSYYVTFVLKNKSRKKGILHFISWL